GALRHGRRWMQARRVRATKWYLPAGAQVIPQPVGVVGIIAPWNYPVFLSAGPLAGVLAAGNRVMLKLSEFTPAFSALFARLVAGSFAQDEVAVIEGGPEVAAQFSALPFDHLLFTGSTAVGRKVMAAAAANLTPVTLELGGKSPAVVAPGFPLERAVDRILFGKLMNAGQTCIAPDYVLLPQAEVQAFVAAARRRAAQMYPRGLEDHDYCSIVNARQFGRLAGYLDEARVAGTGIEVLFSQPLDAVRHRLAPHLLVDPPDTLGVMREEIFGPLLPLVPYASAEEAIAYINARPRPLAMYWFDNDRARITQALQATHAGGVTINDTLLHIAQEGLPFGGIGPSGIGHYHGRWGFDAFSKLKPVLRQPRLNALGLFGAPYRPLAKQMLALMKRF
ncbi:MAG TPA: coniferyl aldehyde dehydrogenase, partial [Burkholderiaceae bacterium]|nr:coniferyl aldehyde dehydrogenase [Burkholderiaceae bacterium]